MRSSISSRGGYKGKLNPNYGNTKIKKEEWDKIRYEVKEEKTPVTSLASKYNVHLQTIYNILNKKEE